VDNQMMQKLVKSED